MSECKYMPPYLGAAYYPEDWPESEMERDAEKMVAAGISVARIAEFAWSRMEPAEGEYHFEWLHRVVETLAAHGIATVMCTPTATPPAWMTHKYPDMRMEMENGRRNQHGGRRHCCSNKPEYRAASARIVEAMAKEFAGDENIIGWQIDNEIYAWGLHCCCPVCAEKFRALLRERFGTVEAMNAAWDLGCWSQEYSSFEQVPVPRDAWHDPHLVLAWTTFQQDSHADFVTMQAEILKKYVKVPIGTDTMPVNGMNYVRLNRKLDIVQFNHYNDETNLWEVGLWFDFLRNIKDRPFWNTETATCWNGSTTIVQTTKPDGFCYANSWLPLALGGEANMYWLWRTHWAGHELMHGSVLEASGRPLHIFNEVRSTADSFAKAGEFLRATRVKADCAIHFPSTSWNIFASQKIVAGLEYNRAVLESFYKPVIDAGLRPDVLETSMDIEKYKLIFTPFVPYLGEDALDERLKAWVEAGGTWVVGPMTDIRGCDGVKFRDRNLGMLEEFADVYLAYSAPDLKKQFVCTTPVGRKLGGSIWYELYRGGEGSLANVEAAPHSALQGHSVLLRRKIGKGQVILLGFIPTAQDMREVILPAACEAAGIACGNGGESYIVVPREGDDRRGRILVELAGTGGVYTLEKPMTDILTGSVLSGKVELAPYQVLVLEETL